MAAQCNDDAVSPVIGVILMVSITVILAAVIASFVFGMSGNIQRTYVVAATFTQNSVNDITITFSGGQDSQYVTNLSVFINNQYAGTIGNNDNTPMLAGCSTTFLANPPNSFVRGTHVTATAHFVDGSSQVILDHFV